MLEETPRIARTSRGSNRPRLSVSVSCSGDWKNECRFSSRFSACHPIKVIGPLHNGSVPNRSNSTNEQKLRMVSVALAGWYSRPTSYYRCLRAKLISDYEQGSKLLPMVAQCLKLCDMFFVYCASPSILAATLKNLHTLSISHTISPDVAGKLQSGNSLTGSEQCRLRGIERTFAGSSILWDVLTKVDAARSESLLNEASIRWTIDLLLIYTHDIATFRHPDALTSTEMEACTGGPCCFKEHPGGS